MGVLRLVRAIGLRVLELGVVELRGVGHRGLGVFRAEVVGCQGQRVCARVCAASACSLGS